MDNYDALTATVLWFEPVAQEPTPKSVHTQLGVHFEEVKEMIQELQTEDQETSGLLIEAERAIHKLAEHLKKHDNAVYLPDHCRIGMIDALCDQIVTAVGSAYMFKMDIIGAMQEVNSSNYSKFVDGKPIFDANRKVMKGPNYKKADLSRFV